MVYGETLTFQGIIRFMEDYRNGRVQEMSKSVETIIVSLYVMFRSESRFEQLSNTEVTWDKIEDIIHETIELFGKYIEDRDSESIKRLSFSEKVDIIPVLRSKVKEKYAIYNTIDGDTLQWWENVYDPRHLTLQDIPIRLQEKINQSLSSPFQASSLEYQVYFREVAERFLQEKGNVIPLLEIMVKDLIEDEAIGGADCSILVGPRKILTDRPWDMTEDEYLFCTVYLVDDYDPQSHGLKANVDMVQNMVVTRMFVDKIRKAHYYNPDEMVRYAKSVAHLAVPDRSISQHAHQKGHAAAGVRVSLRAPIAFEVECKDGTRLFPGFSDVRLFRSNNADEFSEEALFRTITYSRWMKLVFELSFAKGYELTPDHTDPNITFFSREGNKKR